MNDLNLVCTFSAREGLRIPIIVAVTAPGEKLDSYWATYEGDSIFCSPQPDGFYTIRRLNMGKQEPENLRNSDTTLPERETLILEYKILVKSEDALKEDSWIARRLKAIRGFLGYAPEGDLPKDHPGKIPNRRLP